MMKNVNNKIMFYKKNLGKKLIFIEFVNYVIIFIYCK